MSALNKQNYGGWRLTETEMYNEYIGTSRFETQVVIFNDSVLGILLKDYIDN